MMFAFFFVSIAKSKMKKKIQKLSARVISSKSKKVSNTSIINFRILQTATRRQEATENFASRKL